MQDITTPAPIPDVYFTPRVAVYAAMIVLAVFVQQQSVAALGGSALAWLNTILIVLFAMLGSLQLCFALLGLMLGLSLAILAFVARRRGCGFEGQLPNRRQVVDYVLSFAILMATSLLLLGPAVAVFWPMISWPTK